MLHDVISIRHAKKALEAGVDGLILVATGAGGHAGTLSPFALVGECASSSTARGAGRHDRHRRRVLAAQAMGADLAYIGTRLIATKNRTRRRLPR